MTAGRLRISDRAPGGGALGREKDWNRVEDQEPRLPSVPGETLRTQEYLRRSLGFNVQSGDWSVRAQLRTLECCTPFFATVEDGFAKQRNVIFFPL